MKTIPLANTTILLFFFGATGVYSQEAPAPKTAFGQVPRLVRWSSTFRPNNGQPTAAIESVTLSVYKDQQDNAPLWHEMQNVTVDAEGRYSMLIGSTLPEGLPAELFSSGEPRWLGVQFNRPGEAEQPRVLLASVPYALRAADAETLGGRPPSAYLLAPPADAPSNGREASAAPAAGARTPKASVGTPAANSGSTGFIGKFLNTTDLVNSAMFDNGGNIGIGTTAAGARLAVAGQAAVGSGNATQTFGFDLYVNGANPRAFIDAYGNPGVATLILQGRGATASNHQLSVNSSGLFSIVPGSGANGLTMNQAGNLSLGTLTPWAGAKLQLRNGANQNLAVGGPLGLATGIALHSFNDAVNANQGLELRGSPILLNVGNVGIGAPAPVSKLDVAGDINTSGNILVSGTPVLRAFGDLGNFTSGNLGVGPGALQSNPTGTVNTAVGAGALRLNSGGNSNTAVGENALTANNTGSYNTASGESAMSVNTSGTFNTAIGFRALAGNTTGINNTALGKVSLPNNTTGNYNIGIGNEAGIFGPVNGNNNFYIGSAGAASDNNTIRIGNGGGGTHTAFFAGGIRGVTTGNSDALPVVIDFNGQLGTINSSRRFKEDIHDMGEASRDLLRLRPVTFRYKKPYADGSKPVQYGLIAEEVAEVFPDLVARSADGEIESVKYQLLDSLLLNEVQRQHAEIEGLQQQNQDLQRRLARLEAALAKSSDERRLP